MSLFSELKRRNVFRVGVAYIVAAWLIIQVAETIFPLFGFSDTPARIVVILLAIGFPLFLIFSWVFEITPVGLKLEKDVEREASITPQTGKKLDRTIIVLLALGLGYFAVDKFVLEPARIADIVEETAQQARSDALVESYGDRSIAVLPFVNLSADPEQEYFSDGISEELLNLLARIPELRVIARTSSFSYKGKEVKITDIARELNVGHVLEGSVRKAGDSVRITAQLIDARSDTHLWSDTYDRTLNNIFATQNEIAASVVEQLKIALLGESPKAAESDPEAYALYLQARHLYQHGTQESAEKAVGLYQQALAIDPDYAAGWTGLAAVYTRQANSGFRLKDEGFRLAREAASRSLALDPEDATVYELLGFIALNYDDLETASGLYRRALELDPTDPGAVGGAASMIRTLGRIEEAITLEEYRCARDPVNPAAYYNLGFSNIHAGRWDESIDAFRTVLMVSPDFVGAHYFLGLALLLKGESTPALAAFKKEQDDVFRVKGTALALHALGSSGGSEAALQELIERSGDPWPQEIAHVYAWMGNADEAFAWLDRAVAQNKYEGDHISPFYIALHADPRWPVFLERTGQSEAQLAAIQFEASLPD